MMQCWRENPESRPSFNELTSNLSNLMKNDVVEYYVNLNEPYMKVNETNFADGHPDYLAMMAVPGCKEPSVSLCENGNAFSKDTRESTMNDLNDHNMNTEGISEPNHVATNKSPITNQRNNSYIPEEIPIFSHSNKLDPVADLNAKINQNSHINVSIDKPKDSVSSSAYVFVENEIEN